MALQPFDICIDVGDAQPSIDWDAVYAAGIRIAMIKATEGSNWLQPYFDAQYWGAARANIKVIPYHFLRPSPAQTQAQFFASVDQPGKGDALALDWEGRASQTAAPAVAEAVGNQLMQITGRLPLGYWGIPGSTPATPTPGMMTWPRWVGRYPENGIKSWADMPASIQAEPEKWWPGALFAQYTMWGSVPGIEGSVDRSVVFANSIDEAIAWCDTGVMPA
jgi:lysozyme